MNLQFGTGKTGMVDIPEGEARSGAPVSLLAESSESKCRCRRCLTERGAIRTGSLTGHDLTTMQTGKEFVGMILCEICGNKRCPHATDHRHACTDSNDSGQPGSIFG